MSDMYSLRHPISNKRVVSLAVRNRDAAIWGEGGPEAGDIIYKLAEGYNQDHADSLSTTNGFGDTSVASIFVAAGQGVKKDFRTERIVKHQDVVPTAAVLMGLRTTAQCDGAPVYQVLDGSEL